MRFFRFLFGMLWRFWFFLVAIIVFLGFFPLFYFFLAKPNRYPKAFKLKKTCGKLMLAPAGIKLRIIEQPDLSNIGPCVITPNHSSYLDIILTFVVIPFYFHFMGKAELGKVPLFRKFFDDMHILVDRGSMMASHRSLRRAATDIDRGISIAIFPEATIPMCTPELGRFKNGAFKLAIEKQVPILPVIYLDNYHILPDVKLNQHTGSPGLCRVIIKEPVPTAGLTDKDVDSLKTRIFTIINDTLKEHIHADQ